MKNVIAHAHRHFKGHINDHKHHYLFGIFGGFALFKLFLLLMGITVVQYTVFTNAQEDTIEDPNPIVEEDGIDGIDEIDEEEDGIDGIDEEEDGIDEEEDGIDEEEDGIDEEEDGIDEKEDGIDEEIVDEEIVDEEILDTNNEWNGICESGSLTFSRPLSGSNVRNILDIVWNYTGCSVSGMLLQLWDHNQQRIDLTTLASGATSYAFDSASLYSFQQSGLYHIVGTNMSGNDYYLYTGQYTGVYSRLYTGYMLRLVSSDKIILDEIGPFTIDNVLPTLTGLVVSSSDSSTGYLGIDDVVNVSFTSSESLSGVVVSLGSKPGSLSIKTGLDYTYTRTLSSLYSEGPLVANIAFADIAGNTGALVYTSALVFDMTAATVTGFVFSGHTSGIQLNFTSSELTRVDFDYGIDGDDMIDGVVTNYLTSHQLVFDTIEVDEVYTFNVNIFDRANNSRGVTGDFIKTAEGDISSHIYIVPLATDELLSGEILSLTNILKAEVEKFNSCKEAISYTPVELEIRDTTFHLSMPNFKKSQVRILVNAFTLFVLDNLKSNVTVTDKDIDEITKKFDNFLVILKLFRDDDNECKQNLSNYHINQFKRAMEEYKITLD